MQATASKGIAMEEVPITEEPLPRLDVPYYLPVSLIKFSLLCLCTTNLYMLYWFYWNWDMIAKRKKKSMSPLLRALFAVFTVHSMARELKEDAKEAGIPVDSSFDSAAGLFMILTFGPALAKTGEILTSFNFVALLPFVILMQQINNERAPKCPPNDTFGLWNIFLLVFGGAFFGMVLMGNLLSFLNWLG